MSGPALDARPASRQWAPQGAQVRMKSEVRAILAADAEVAAMALRPAAAEVSLQREKVPARMLHSQGQEQADRCTPRDKHRSLLRAAVAGERDLPIHRPNR